MSLLPGPRNQCMFTRSEPADLSSKMLRSTRFGTSTQKAEAVNSAFRTTTNPKHSSTFSQNGRFRDHSAIHMVNNGPGESIARKMESVGLELSQNSRCSSTLKEIQKTYEYGKERKRGGRYRTRKAQLRAHKYKLHEKCHDAASSSYLILISFCMTINMALATWYNPIFSASSKKSGLY